MGLSIGIVGLPNVGKSTLLQRAHRRTTCWPRTTRSRPSSRTSASSRCPTRASAVLAALYDAPKAIPATVTFLDIAGIVQGASEGEGLGNQFLAEHPRDRRDLRGRPAPSSTTTSST